MAWTGMCLQVHDRIPDRVSMNLSESEPCSRPQPSQKMKTGSSAASPFSSPPHFEISRLPFGGALKGTCIAG